MSNIGRFSLGQCKLHTCAYGLEIERLERETGNTVTAQVEYRELETSGDMKLTWNI